MIKTIILVLTSISFMHIYAQDSARKPNNVNIIGTANVEDGSTDIQPSAQNTNSETTNSATQNTSNNINVKEQVSNVNVISNPEISTGNPDALSVNENTTRLNDDLNLRQKQLEEKEAVLNQQQEQINQQVLAQQQRQLQQQEKLEKEKLKTQARHEQTLNTEVQSTISQIKTEVTNKSCTSDVSCQSIGIGQKSCGGPQNYIVYSSDTTDVSKLSQLVNQYNQLKIQQQSLSNSNSGSIFASTCEVTPYPEVFCSNANRCEKR